MNLKVIRYWPGVRATLGQMFVDGAAECFTLEPPFGVEHPPIPIGTYGVTMRTSNRFGREVPHIEDVPGRSDILIHPGNTAKDTHGCILVGEIRVDDGTIRLSGAAATQLNDKIAKAIEAGQSVTIKVEGVDEWKD